MAEAVQVYLDAVREVAKRGELVIEHRFNLDWLYPDMFGTNDASVAEPYGELHVFDYKHGKGVAVDVVENPQLMYYGLGACYGEDFSNIVLHIVQPRAPHRDGPVRSWRITQAELIEWGKTKLLDAAKAVEDHSAPLHTGEHCRFCPALAICPEVRRSAFESAIVLFDDDVMPVASEKIDLPDITTLPPAKLASLLDVLDVIEPWFNSVRGHAKTLRERGVEIPGYKLVDGKGTRKWADESLATSRLVSLLKQDAYKPFVILTVAQAEAKLKEVKGYTKKEAKEELADLVTISRGTNLVKASDPRQEINPKTALDLFEDETLEGL